MASIYVAMPDTWFERTHGGGGSRSPGKRSKGKKNNSFVAEAVKRVPNRDLEPAKKGKGDDWRSLRDRKGATIRSAVPA